MRRMHFACWNTKATDTHSEYVILIDFTRQQWLRERTSVLRLCVHCFFFLLYYRRSCCVRYFLSSNVVRSADHIHVRWSGGGKRRDSCLITLGPYIKWTSVRWQYCSPCCGRCTLWAESRFLFFLFSHIFRFIALVTAIPYLLSFYDAERDSHS